MAKQHYSSFQCHMILRIFNIINVENIFEDFLMVEYTNIWLYKEFIY